MTEVRNLYRAIILLLLAVSLPRHVIAAEAGGAWQDEWNRTINAAEQEGQLILYSLSEIGDAISNTNFQKKFPKIKISVVTARGGEHVSRIMAERRAGKFLADVGNLGNTSPYTLYQSKVLEPIASSYILPEVKDESKWWQGKQHFIDPEGKYILVYVGAPLFLVGYNTKLVNPSGFKSYWDLLDPKWKGKIVVFDSKAGGFAATRDRFFYHNPDPQGEDWLAAGKYSLCLCRHQSISEAKSQGLPVDLMEPGQFKEGVGVETRAKTMVLMNQAPHPNAAKVFLNWFLSREGQSDFQKTGAKYLDAGAEGSLRIDIPKDDIPPRNRLNPGVKYVPQWNPDFFEMKPIAKVINEAQAEAAKKKE